MEGNTAEITPTNEGQQSTKTVAKPQPEQQTEQKSGLALRLTEIRADAEAHAQKAIQLLGTYSPEAETQKAQERVTPEAARSQLEVLVKEEGIPSAEFISRSRQALKTSAQLRDQTMTDQRTLEEQVSSHQSDIGEIDEKIRETDRVKGIKRIPAALEKRRLERQKAVAQRQIDQLKLQVEAKQQLIDQITEQEKPIRQKQEEIIFAEIGEEVQAICSEYEKLNQEILQDGAITAEIREAYIQQVIAPEVDKIAAQKNLPASQKGAFYAALQTYIDHREEPEAQIQPYRQELNNLFTHEGGFWEVKHYCIPLLRGGDKVIVQRLVVKMVAEEIIPVKTAAESRLRDYEQISRFNRIFENAVEPADRQNGNSFGSQILRQVDEHKAEYLWDSFNMKLWQATKSSKTANEIFGEVIQRQDQEYYTAALDGSLSDNFCIQLLRYYPTPDAIRNLVLIAAADHYRSDRALYANRSLNALSKRPDWKQLLDEAEVVYPPLKATRFLLESWNYQEFNNHPDIQQAAEDLSLAILESKPNDQRLTELSIESLPSSTILSILAEKGIIQQAQAKVISEAESVLKKLSEENRQKQRENGYSVPYLEGYLQNTRGVLKELMRQGEAMSTDETIGSFERLTSLSKRILENQSNYPVLSYLVSGEVVETLTKRKVDPELIFSFPEHAKALMDDKMRETRLFVFQHGDSLLKDTSDIRFMNNLVGEFGKKSDQLIRGYQECLVSGVISTADKELVLEFARQFRVISPPALQGYKEAKEAGQEKVYIAQLQALAERMTGSGVITDEERKRPYYNDLLRHVYSNNSGQWTSFESNNRCPDRSSDLTEFKIKPRYEIDLLSQSEIRVKAGETLDDAVQKDVQRAILEVAERMETLGHDKEKIQAALQENVDKTLQEILQKGGLQNISLESVTTLDEKLFLILTDSIYGSGAVDSSAIKNLIITYEFATFEDINDYIAGTRDRVGRANNQDYALLCELGTFYSDRIKEVIRRLVQTAWNNPTIAAAMPDYFRRLAQETIMTQRKDLINRLQIDRLGTSDSFIKQVGKTLEKRRGRKYTPDEVKALIQRYESWVGGLTEKASTSPKLETRAFYGQLRSQRERTFEALEAITGQKVDPKEAHLGEINLQQVLATEANIREGKYDEEQFASYTVQRFIDLFEDERTKINRELSKFESLSGKQREILYGYITKSKESAHARMVGGVCVAGDNPDRYPEGNMWSMPNYFQMVFQEPDTLQCQGLVLLHHFNEGGKKVLTASFNPSSTYLYSVDEAALFNGITSALEQFAAENGFDIIAVPHNRTIRTNRTGGEFEKAMDQRVAQVGKPFKFDAPQQFSYHPNYQIQEMDIIWERGATQPLP